MTLDEPLSLQAMLDEAMRQARRHFKTIYPAVAVPLALTAGLLPLTQGLWLRSFRFGSAGPTPGEMVGFFGGLAAMVFVSFAFLFVYVVGYGARVAGAVEALSGRPVVMSQMWLAMVRPKALFTIVLTWLATMAGVVCCVLPGVYLATLFSMVVPVMIEEGRFLADGMGRSSELATYNPRKSFGDDPRVRAFLILFVGMLIGYAISMVVQMPLLIVQQVIMFRGMAGGERTDPVTLMASLTWLQVPTNALAMAGQVAVHLYVSFGLALLYFDVRRRKEGRDLESAVDVLSQRAPSDSPA